MDSFLTGKFQNDNIVKGCLPSLFTIFYLSKDSKLSSKILELIMKSFNQRFELVESIKKIEILFEKGDVNSLNKLTYYFNILRPLAQTSEV